MSNLADRLTGRFIVLDGPDGAGKTTQLGLLAEHLTGLGATVESVHDPGATAVGEKIRKILLDREHAEMAPLCETLLFMASRAQLMAQRVRPALAEGKVVLCDRFISATVAYQGASGVDRKTILELGRIAVAGRWPDLTIILDVPVELGMRRIKPPLADRMEARDRAYHEQVRENFKALAGAYPGPVQHVSGEAEPPVVFRRIRAKLAARFGA